MYSVERIYVIYMYPGRPGACSDRFIAAADREESCFTA